jgi:hypothetical protein
VVISVAANVGAGAPSAAGIAVGRGEDAAWRVADACGVAIGVGRSAGMALLAGEGWLDKNVGVDGKNVAVSGSTVGTVAAGAEQLAIDARATRTIDSAVQAGRTRRRRASARPGRGSRSARIVHWFYVKLSE